MGIGRGSWRRAVDETRVREAIRAAEARTSGEIRVSVSPLFLGDVRAGAERAFERMGMTRTRLRNGVLFFVVPARRRFVVLGDAGIHQRVGEEFWREIADAISMSFRRGDFTGGLVRGIEVAGARLADHFPREAGDVNELPDTLDMAHEHDHGHKHEHGHEGGTHGNPPDLAGYVARLEDPARAEWQKPDELLRAMGVASGMVVGEIGPGPGFFTKRLAAAVGERGHVYAAEVVPEILGVLRDRLRGVANVTPILADADDPRLPRGRCDRILVVNTYHHFPDGPGYLRRLAASLASGGEIVNVDFEKRETPMGPPLEQRVSREDFLRDAEKAGLSARVLEIALPYQYAIALTSR